MNFMTRQLDKNKGKYTKEKGTNNLIAVDTRIFKTCSKSKNAEKHQE